MLDNDHDEEYGLLNPYSKVTCFILYLYSMELGSPPLYAELNREARDSDMTQLRNLGPFLTALYYICELTEFFRKGSDKIRNGEILKNRVSFNMAGSYLMFKGVRVKEEWLQPWFDMVGERVKILGN